MRKTAFYVSDHGFGHASRSIEIIRQLLTRDKDVEVIVNTSAPLDFIKNSLKEYESRVIYRKVKNDIGLILKPESLYPDVNEMQSEVTRWVQRWDSIVTDEVDYYKGNPVHLIISDITPHAFLITNRLDIPSIGISNFTWYTMYSQFIPSDALCEFKRAYEHMDYFFSLAFHNETEILFQNQCDFGVYARQINKEEVKRIRALLPDNTFLIHIGIGKSVDFKYLEKLKFSSNSKLFFLVSSGSDIEGGNIIKIPQEYCETQNYIAACDLVITKAGWSTIAECLLAQVPFIVLEREMLPEDRNTVDALKSLPVCAVKTISELENMDFNIESMEQYIDMKRYYKQIDRFYKENCSGAIADKVLEILGESI
ncbi:MAG: hypothetical protein JG776_2464 [Caloramator sp.]|jgi:uncharacterized protein (TIGR00661 family)|uniref:glycosyltransferase n=1 Tax=Caloramator sp. TaxID=1871330 RepID=UPI001D371B74|nr:glycosyltransferase [Caloramator sp.]MBZ4664740.1 hypothetical protein [Caloramator sp.]